MANADCIVIQGSNMAECHPVGYQWVTEAKARGARVIHVDPRFTRTSAVADKHVPIRAGSDIVWLGALIKYVLDNEKYFKEYVVAYTNAGAILREDFRDTEDLDGVFSGFDSETGTYDETTWEYEDAAVGAAAGQRSPTEPGGAAAAAAGDAAAIAGGKGVPVDRNMKSTQGGMVDARLLQIYDGERSMGDHNTILRGNKPVVRHADSLQ